MGSGVEDAKEKQRIGKLSVHPDILVERDKPDLGPDPPHDGSADRKEDKHSIHTQNQTGTSRNPHRVHERIETREAGIGRLLPPKRPVSAIASPFLSPTHELPDKTYHP
jgi:transposase InsO family protein